MFYLLGFSLIWMNTTWSELTFEEVLFQPKVPTIKVVVDMVAPQRRIAKIIGGEVDVKA